MTEERVAVVTGSSRGIGKAVAKLLAARGFAVAMNGTVAEAQVADALAEVAAYGRPVVYLQGDVGTTAGRRLLVDGVMKRFGRIDALVNNAGVAPRERRDILETTEESFDYVLDVNLKGLFFLTQAVAGIMIRQGSLEGCGTPPVIVNISSISAYTPSVERGEYCISKAGVGMVTKLFAQRLAEFGIRVYEVRPGIIETDMTRGVQEKYSALIAAGLTPIRRWGRPEDVARTVAMLCEDCLCFSTGEVINVDGGFHLRKL